MLFFKFLNTLFVKKCEHSKLLPHIDSAYCPDCGKLIKNQWYITKCSCCGVKLVTCVNHGKISPLNLYCQNCGSQEYIIEEIDKINFIDINYAALIKKEVEVLSSDFANTTQCWQEKNNEQPKLLAQYL